uniref:Ribosomal protein S9 n=1 Tax=Euglena clara TaxID=215708 RepID=A0A2Z4YVV4_9EUGL|nr:ribosomal protein S9 [Euglena clara]AXA45469.1 ribosomal protein S9 [Euglena clara]
MELNITSIGKRKSSIAKINLREGLGNVIINAKPFSDYLQNNPSDLFSVSPLMLLGLEKRYDIFIVVCGGGLSGQADAIKLGISRALYKLSDLEDKKNLKLNGFLTRNSLCKERRYGLKKARKAPQFSKR